MKNTGGRNAGSITAAQFLKRFVAEVPWAHLDIAGTAMAVQPSDINKSWGPGWGVRLLDKLCRRPLRSNEGCPGVRRTGSRSMTEVLFYHMQSRTLEQALPPLLTKCLERGWRVVVQAATEERVEALDGHLWTYDDQSFCRTAAPATPTRRTSRSS